jgi:hypothetical protein
LVCATPLVLAGPIFSNASSIGERKKKNPNTTLLGFFHLSGFDKIYNFILVNLREPSAKLFWDELERFGVQLEELGVGDDQIRKA